MKEKLKGRMKTTAFNAMNALSSFCLVTFLFMRYGIQTTALFDLSRGLDRLVQSGKSWGSDSIDGVGVLTPVLTQSQFLPNWSG
jgi:hypothetical protein